MFLPNATVREFVELARALYPKPRRTGRDPDPGRPAPIAADAPARQAVRRRGEAGAVRVRAGRRPGPAGAGRADGGDGRRRPAGVLGGDAPTRRPRPYGAVRDPLPRRRPTTSPTGWSSIAHGRIVADGPTAQIKRAGQRPYGRVRSGRRDAPPAWSACPAYALGGGPRRPRPHRSRRRRRHGDRARTQRPRVRQPRDQQRRPGGRVPRPHRRRHAAATRPGTRARRRTIGALTCSPT